MATRRRSQLSSYRTYGSVAYAPAYDGTAVRAPRREEVLRPKPRVRPRERVLTRTQVQVREAGQASVFAVIGFLAVGVFAALLLLSYTQYAVLTDQVVTLRSELTTLQTENATLSAEYEKVFDMERIQAAVGDTMIRPTGDQVEYIDLSEPDSVVVYGQEDAKTGIPGLLAGLEEIISSLIEYFRCPAAYSDPWVDERDRPGGRGSPRARSKGAQEKRAFLAPQIIKAERNARQSRETDPEEETPGWTIAENEIPAAVDGRAAPSARYSVARFF